MQLSEMISDVRSRINEPVARLFTNTELTRWINLGYKDFINKALPCENVKAFAVYANQTRYAKPANAILLEEVLWEERYEIVCLDILEFRKRLYLNPSVTGTIPAMYAEYPGFSNPEVQIWPIPTANSQSTTLNGSLNTTAATIPVASTTNFPRTGWLIIDDEQIWYNNTDATNFLQCERGKGGTTAATHSNGATVAWGKLTMRYVYDAPLLVNSTDSPAFPESWHEAVILYATHIAFQKMGKDPQANVMMQEYQRFITQANNVRQSRTYDRGAAWSGWDFNYLY